MKEKKSTAEVFSGIAYDMMDMAEYQFVTGTIDYEKYQRTLAEARDLKFTTSPDFLKPQPHSETIRRIADYQFASGYISLGEHQKEMATASVIEKDKILRMTMKKRNVSNKMLC
jgi:hypothetical protein